MTNVVSCDTSATYYFLSSVAYKQKDKQTNATKRHNLILPIKLKDQLINLAERIFISQHFSLFIVFLVFTDTHVDT